MAVDATCPECRRPLIEIDHYGERLIGCIECNRWGRPGDYATAQGVAAAAGAMEAIGAGGQATVGGGAP
jgi:hypothetical protein